MRVESQPAYILHSRNFRDSSLIVDFLTVDYGRVSAVVKGVRSATKTARQRRAIIQPFIPLLLSWTGKSELKTIIQCEARGAPIALAGQRLFSGFYVNELLTRLLQPSDEHPELYTLYEWVLGSLVKEPLEDVVLRHFELQLLDYLGYGVDLISDIETGEPIQSAKYYRFMMGQGFSEILPTMMEGRFSDGKSEEGVYPGEELLLLARGEFSGSVRRVARQLCREALKPHLGGKPLKSRDLFR